MAILKRPSINVSGDALPASPYGTPYLVFDSLRGKEVVNQLFEYELVLRSLNEFGQPTHGYKGLQGYVSKDVADAGGSPGSHLNLKAMIGTEITLGITLDGVLAAIEGLAELGLSNGERDDDRKDLTGGGIRYISGMVSRVEQVGIRNRHALYKLTLVPSLWLLTKTTDYKIFQNKSVTHIIDEVLDDYTFAIETRYSQEYPHLDFTVQYGQTDFDFISQLMAEYGINYHFEYPQGKQLLVLGDHAAAFTPLPSNRYQNLWVYPPDQGFPLKQEYIERFEPVQILTSGAVRLADYQFKQPQSNQSVSASHAWETQHSQLEVYEWAQGSYLDDTEAGPAKAHLNAQRQHQYGLRAEGYGRLRGLAAGHTFTLYNHPNTTSNQAWLILGTELDISDLSTEDANTMFYDAHVRFIVQSASEPLLPDAVNTLPKAYTQTATVVGPAEEEIHVDQYGRVKVQFHWDEYGAKDEHSTCWLRVSSAWAGMNYGAMHIPRIGQEVIVSFFNANPDMPFISGRLTNPEHMPLWELPSQKALSGFKSKELNGGKNNHLIMDDTPGETQVQLGSEHQHSQLNLGHITRVPTALGRNDHRGEGFELRSDGWGAVRADKGLLLTTHGRGSAVSHARDLSEASGLLQNAHNQHQVFNQLAIKAKADERSIDNTAQIDLKQQHVEISGANGTRSKEQRFVELQTPHMVLSSPAGIALATEANVHVATQGHTAITAQKDFSASVGKRFLASVGEGISLFTQRFGIKLFASKGKVEIQAHSDNVEIIADKTVKIISANGKIEIAAQKEKVLTCGGAYIRFKDGNIQIHAPGFIDMKAGSFPHAGPTSIGYAMPIKPESESFTLGRKFVLREASSTLALANVPYEIVLDDQRKISGQTNDWGETALAESDTYQIATLKIYDTENNLIAYKTNMVYQDSQVADEVLVAMDDKSTRDQSEHWRVRNGTTTMELLKDAAIDIHPHNFGMAKVVLKEGTGQDTSGQITVQAVVAEEIVKRYRGILDGFDFATQTVEAFETYLADKLLAIMNWALVQPTFGLKELSLSKDETSLLHNEKGVQFFKDFDGRLTLGRVLPGSNIINFNRDFFVFDLYRLRKNKVSLSTQEFSYLQSIEQQLIMTASHETRHFQQQYWKTVYYAHHRSELKALGIEPLLSAILPNQSLLAAAETIDLPKEAAIIIGIRRFLISELYAVGMSVAGYDETKLNPNLLQEFIQLVQNMKHNHTGAFNSDTVNTSQFRVEMAKGRMKAKDGGDYHEGYRAMPHEQDARDTGWLVGALYDNQSLNQPEILSGYLSRISDFSDPSLLKTKAKV